MGLEMADFIKSKIIARLAKYGILYMCIMQFFSDWILRGFTKLYEPSSCIDSKAWVLKHQLYWVFDWVTILLQ